MVDRSFLSRPVLGPADRMLHDRVDVAALLVYRAASVKDATGARIGSEGSRAKPFATEEAQRMIDGAVQPFGGLEVTKWRIAEWLCREIRAWRICDGAREVQQAIIAGRLLHEPGTTDP